MGLEIGVEAERETTRTLTGEFADERSAAAAVSAIQALGVGPEEVALSRAAAEVPSPQEIPVEPFRGGAATGATFGGVIGVLFGWMVGVEALALPGVGVVRDAGALPTMLAGLGLGAAAGGLVGALIGLGIPRRVQTPAQDPSTLADGPITISVVTPLLLADSVETALIANGATGVQGNEPQVTMHRATETAGPGETLPSYSQSATLQEETTMENNNNGQELGTGRDTESITGTSDAIDPETGALGTGGTPMTTGYGVSGSTVGTGTEAGRIESEAGEEHSPTPDASAYESGGRASDDSPEKMEGTEHGQTVVEKYGPVEGEDTSGRDKAGGADHYTQSEGYGGALEPATDPDEDSSNVSEAEQYSSASPDEPPSYANVESSQAQESAGTNIPGTEDPTGLGDNTDR